MTKQNNAASVAVQAAACLNPTQAAELQAKLPGIQQVQFLACMTLLGSLESADEAMRYAWCEAYHTPSKAIDMAMESAKNLMQATQPMELLEGWLTAWHRIGAVLTLARGAMPDEATASCYLRMAENEIDAFSLALMSLSELAWPQRAASTPAANGDEAKAPTPCELARAWSEQTNVVFECIEAAAKVLEDASADAKFAAGHLHDALEMLRESPAEYELLHTLEKGRHEQPR
jgi:hypothetical protein